MVERGRVAAPRRGVAAPGHLRLWNPADVRLKMAESWPASSASVSAIRAPRRHRGKAGRTLPPTSAVTQIDFQFVVLDPRPTQAGDQANAAVFQKARVLGIEVTVPALAARCDLGNIDPQHTGSNPRLAAIEAAIEAELPPHGSVLATIRPDLDSLGAMALLWLRAEGLPITTGVVGRVTQVAVSDRFAHGQWPGRRPVSDEVSKETPLAAIGAAAMDHELSLASRVGLVRNWLTNGSVPDVYAERVRRERDAITRLLAEGSVRVEPRFGGRVVVVEGSYRGALSIGYLQAPVVIARDSTFRFQGGAPHVKYTVAQYARGYVDLVTGVARLVEREEGWGGSPTIIGSPQGTGSALSLDEVLDIVFDRLAAGAGDQPRGATGAGAVGQTSDNLALPHAVAASLEHRR